MGSTFRDFVLIMWPWGCDVMPARAGNPASLDVEHCTCANVFGLVWRGVRDAFSGLTLRVATLATE